MKNNLISIILIIFILMIGFSGCQDTNDNSNSIIGEWTLEREEEFLVTYFDNFSGLISSPFLNGNLYFKWKIDTNRLIQNDYYSDNESANKFYQDYEKTNNKSFEVVYEYNFISNNEMELINIEDGATITIIRWNI